MDAQKKVSSPTKTKDSQIIPSVTVHIPMPPGAAIPAQANPSQNPTPQVPVDSFSGSK
jgi:hypothetical protein